MNELVLPAQVVVDANFLIAWLGKKTSHETRQRITYFAERANKAKVRIVVPVPALAEFLVYADTAAIETLNALDRKSAVYLAPFDRMAAFDCAQLDRASLGAGDKKDGATDAWQKVKIDRQIVAIGKSLGAGLIISNDGDVRSNAIRAGMRAITLDELELPPSAAQALLDFPEANARGRNTVKALVSPTEPPSNATSPATDSST